MTRRIDRAALALTVATAIAVATFMPALAVAATGTERFTIGDPSELAGISVGELAIGREAPPVQNISITTETAAPPKAVVNPSKSAAGDVPASVGSVSSAFGATSASGFRPAAITGTETGYVNLDGTTRSGIATPPELSFADAQMYGVTFYCACMECCGKTNAITASGAHATAGVTVAAASTIPFGTRVWIEGYGERVVQDRGGAIGANRLDVYVNTHAEALSHGSRPLRVWFL